jgi:ribosome biogenesis GTPase A
MGRTSLFFPRWCACLLFAILAAMISRTCAFMPLRNVRRLAPQCQQALLRNNSRKSAAESCSSRLLSSSSQYFDETSDTSTIPSSGYARPVVQWYPGHIAKAERQLKETFKAVDLVIEVRDARIAKATSHPMVGAWCAGRPRLVVLTHIDQVSTASLKSWEKAYGILGAEHPDQATVLDGQILNQARQAARERAKYTMPEVLTKKKGAAKPVSTSGVAPVQDILFVNAKLGAGIPALTRAIFRAGSHVQERRLRRGLKERPLRVGIIGFPNVGKSALINRLLGRKRAKTANTPGVTRSLQWIRVRNTVDRADGSTKSDASKEFELLDSPGIIPATLMDQSDATLLAACNCIGEAAYDNQAVAAYLCEWLLGIYRLGYGRLAAPDWQRQCKLRYGFDPIDDIPTDILPSAFDEDDESPKFRQRTGEDILYQVADSTCQGDPEDAARKILQDFRNRRMGPICLQIAPSSVGDRGHRAVLATPEEKDEQVRQARQEVFQAAQQARAQKALDAAQERGLELPPRVQEQSENGSDGKKGDSQVGKGLFEGW